MHRRPGGWRPVAAALAIALFGAACLGASATDRAVEIFGAFSGDEETAFVASLAEFTEETGIPVEYVASTDFSTLIRTRVRGGDPPDIGLFPQPGLLLSFANGDAVPLGDVLDLGELEETLVPGFLDAATGDDGEVYGAPMRMAVKSLVWYPIPQFEDAGYEVPETWDELIELQERIVADGSSAWCIGIESGPETGWVATDWVEELMLRIHGPEVYDAWVDNELPFDAPEVQEAGEVFGDIVFGDGNVFGGAQGTITVPFGDAPRPMFEDEPPCYLHRQGNFITGFFPEAVTEDLLANVGIFTLPGDYPGGFDGTPLLGGGDLAALFTDSDEAAEVMRFLASDQFGGPWAEAGGWLSPHTTFDSDNYGAEIDVEIAAQAAEADTFRFDASDVMPGEVGSGSFWTEMVAWLNGDLTLEGALANIEESWPEE